MEDFDRENAEDPQQHSEYAMETFQYYKNREETFRVPDYLQVIVIYFTSKVLIFSRIIHGFGIHQLHLPISRATTRSMKTWGESWWTGSLKWVKFSPTLISYSRCMFPILNILLLKVQESFELNHETLYTAVKMVDLYLSKKQVLIMKKVTRTSNMAVSCEISCLIVHQCQSTHEIFTQKWLYLLEKPASCYRNNGMLRWRKRIFSSLEQSPVWLLARWLYLFRVGEISD